MTERCIKFQKKVMIMLSPFHETQQCLLEKVFVLFSGAFSDNSLAKYIPTNVLLIFHSFNELQMLFDMDTIMF